MKQEILDKLLEYLENSHDFLLEQAPDVIFQVFRYEKISSILGISLCLFLMCLFGFFGWHVFKNPTLDKYGDRNFFSFIFPIMSGMIMPPLFIQIVSLSDNLIKMFVSPKYFLIEMILKLKG